MFYRIQRRLSVNSLSNIRVKPFIRLFAVSAAVVIAAWAQVFASNAEPYRLVNVHTAGILPKASFDVDFRVYASPDGYGSGLLTGVHVGLTNRFNIGLAYGGEGVIGYLSRVRWNKLPGVLVKYRLFEERVLTPALSLGFDNQGYGGLAWKDDRGLSGYGYDGYVYKSPGFFVALSKNYMMFGAVQIGFHGTANYSLEEVDEVTWPNAVVGLDIGVNEELMFIAEYDFALNDITGPRNVRNYGLPHRGFLNLGLRWAFTEHFHIEFDAMDILQNKTRIVLLRDGSVSREPIGWSRELKVAYISSF
jgi:hypothetical protein